MAGVVEISFSQLFLALLIYAGPFIGLFILIGILLYLASSAFRHPHNEGLEEPQAQEPIRRKVVLPQRAEASPLQSPSERPPAETEDWTRG